MKSATEKRSDEAARYRFLVEKVKDVTIQRPVEAPSYESPSLEAFRLNFRASEIPKFYSGPGNLIFTSLVLIASILFCAVSVKHPTPSQLLTVPLTFVYTLFIEYIGHRGPMHKSMKFMTEIYKHTTIHHRFFTYDNFSWSQPNDIYALLLPWYLIFFFLGLLATPIGVAVGILFSHNAGYLFAATAIAYYLSYEWFHFLYHTPETSVLSKLPFLSALRRHHHIHHHTKLMTRYNFNITFPIFDLLFGTYYRQQPSQKVSGHGR